MPLLAIQRGLYSVPVESRFDAYLDTMLMPNRKDIRLPLQNMNPMAKSHVPEILDDYLAIDAEGIAEKVMKDTLANGRTMDGNMYSELLGRVNLSLGLVLADDAQGGWTDRVNVQFTNDFQNGFLWKRGWIDVLLWSSDTDANQETVEMAVELAIHRSAFKLQQQQQQKQTEKQREESEHTVSMATLGDMLEQEAWVWEQYNKLHGHQAPQNEPCVDSLPQYLALLRKLVDQRIDQEFPIVIAAFCGDSAASNLGYPSLGTNGWSGTEVCRRELWKY